MVPPYNGIQLSNKKEQTPNACITPRNVENMLSEKKPDTKEYILLYEPTYMQMERRAPYSDRKQIRGSLRPGVAMRMKGQEAYGIRRWWAEGKVAYL